MVSDRGAGSRRNFTPLPDASRPPTPIRAALDTLASTMGMTDVDGINALFVDWPLIVGEHLAAHCRPRSLRDRVLTIEASDQQWATELRWMSGLLIERCDSALGPGSVSEVRISR